MSDSKEGGFIAPDDFPRTFREVGMKINEIREDVADIKNGQKRVANWIASLISALVVGGILGYLFQK